MQNIKLEKTEKYLAVGYIFKYLSEGKVMEVDAVKITQKIMDAFCWLEELKLARLCFSKEDKVFVLIPLNYSRMEELKQKFDKRFVLAAFERCSSSSEFESDMIDEVIRNLEGLS